MKTYENYLINVLFIILLSISSNGLARKQELITVDNTHFKIYANSLSNRLKPTTHLNNECLQTVGISTSWILFDLGSVVSGIVQLRLYAEQFSENAHIYLSNVKIKMAYTFPLKSISNFTQYENTHFKLCGTTGTVSSGTLNAVVDCKASFDARWVLIKSDQILKLCFVDIMQNAVKPNCFNRINFQNEIFPKVISNLDIFKSMRHTTKLECFQKCYGENACQGIAFAPYETNTGICQFLKKKASNYKFTCEPPCMVSLNICHLGQISQIGSTNEDVTLKIPPFIKNSYALSVEINGNVTCSEENCGETLILISDSRGAVHLCGRIDPLLYDILIKEVFICEKFVKNPTEVMIKTIPQNSQYSIQFNSINIRITKEKSFAYEALIHIRKNFLTSSTQIITTLSTTKTSQSTTLGRKISSSQSNTSLFSFSTIPEENDFISTDKIDYSKSINENFTNNFLSTPPLGSPSSSASITKSLQAADETKSSTTDLKNAIQTLSKDEKLLNAKILTARDRKAFSLNLKKEKYSTVTFNNSRKKTKIPSDISSTNRSIVFQSFHNSSNSPPYIWIILVTFAIILVLVTTIVLLVTFFDGQRKKKEWDIPAHGLFPLDQASEQITLQSSFLDSTIRTNNI